MNSTRRLSSQTVAVAGLFSAVFEAAAAMAPPVLAAPAAPVLAPSPGQSPTLSFSDIADLTIAAPVIVRATVAKAERIADRDSPGLAAGKVRLLLTASVDAAIIAPGTVPATLLWLWDVPLDSRGKPPKPKGATVLAWLAPPGPDGKTRLVAGAGQQPYDPALEASIRAIATAVRSGDTPIFTGVSNGFHVDGTISGESETQFFLKTATGNSVTMVMTVRPGLPRRVAIANGDVIDESAAVVRPGTLLQYRLACFLPAALPPAAGGNDPVLTRDWRAALASIGPCGRTL
jgi:hypothetical protein